MMTLCHTCDTLFAHAGLSSVETARDHALDAHADVLAADPGSLTFTDVTVDPWILLAAPRQIR